jgi:DMSO/TMAO reductase YedYZ molybdopterin-dependent catalytic subunit
MIEKPGLNRRRFITRAFGGIGLLALGGCDKITSSPIVNQVLASAEILSRTVQKAITGRRPLAPEFSDADISADFRVNGTSNPQDIGYQALARNNFADWKLEVGGLVDRPLSLSLADLRQLPARTQITRHDCVEGWSSIGKWTGAKLSALLDLAGPKPDAKYVMFFCADPMDRGGNKYYESIDMEGAYQPQTILAYDFGDAPLPVAHGAPIRLRYETQLGYKMAKYIMRIELVDSYARFGEGKGGYWEDQGYAWYAGI